MYVVARLSAKVFVILLQLLSFCSSSSDEQSNVQKYNNINSQLDATIIIVLIISMS